MLSPNQSEKVCPYGFHLPCEAVEINSILSLDRLGSKSIVFCFFANALGRKLDAWPHICHLMDR